MAYYLFYDRLNNDQGAGLEGYFVRILSAGVVQPIYADKNGTPIATVSGVANAAICDALGNYSIYAAPGIYSLQFLDPNGNQVGSRNDVSLGLIGVNPDFINSLGPIADKINLLGTTSVIASMTALSDPAVLANMAALSPAQVIANMATLAPRASDIATLAPRAADIATLAPRAADIATAATNIAAIIAAPAAAAQATTAASSIGNAAKLSANISSATDVVQVGSSIIATQRRAVSTDSYGLVASTGKMNFPAGARVFGSWSAAHRGMKAPIAGQSADVHELRIPSGTIIGNNNAIVYVGIVTPSAPLPLAFNASVTFAAARLVGTIDLTGLTAQTLGEIVWRGTPVDYADGDLLVYWGPNVQFVYGQNVGATPPANTAYDGQFHMVFSLGARPNDATALSTGFTVSTEPNYRQFPYSASTAAGPVRAGLSGPSSYVATDANNNIPLATARAIDTPWRGKKVGIFGSSIETEGGGGPQAATQIGWARQTVDNLLCAGTVGGVGSSPFCWVGNQGGGGDLLSFSATTAELTAAGGNPANSYQSKIIGQQFDLVVISGGLVNDSNRGGGLMLPGNPSDSTPATVWGAFNRVIPAILADRPTCIIVIEGVQNGFQTIGASEQANRTIYNDTAKAIALAYRLPFLDFFSRSGINASTVATLTGDGLHPLQIEQDRMARYATRFLSSL